MRHTFWLDMRKADEFAIADCIECLKAERSFAATVRDGIRLICDLRAGRTDVLFTLFPWIRDAMQPPPQPVTASEQFERMMQNIARLEALVIEQGRAGAQPAAPLAAPRTPTHTGGVEVAAGGKASAQACADNFLASMKGLAGGFFE